MVTLPPGFRFHPTDEELVAYFLKKRVTNCKMEFEVIPDHDLYKCEPWDLPALSKLPYTDPEWFFFSPRDRKYPNGSRTNRATEAGYWKATGRDRTVRTGNKPIGMKKTLVFYKGRAPHGERTDWLMHEYRLEGDMWEKTNSVQDGYVLCRVFKKNGFGPPLQANWDMISDDVGGEKDNTFEGSGGNGILIEVQSNEVRQNSAQCPHNGVLTEIPSNEVRQNSAQCPHNGVLTEIPSNQVRLNSAQCPQLGTTVDYQEVVSQCAFQIDDNQYPQAGGAVQAPLFDYPSSPVKEETNYVHQLVSPRVFDEWVVPGVPTELVEVKEEEEVIVPSEDDNSVFESPDPSIHSSDFTSDLSLVQSPDPSIRSSDFILDTPHVQSPDPSWDDDDRRQRLLEYGRGDEQFQLLGDQFATNDFSSNMMDRMSCMSEQQQGSAVFDDFDQIPKSNDNLDMWPSVGEEGEEFTYFAFEEEPLPPLSEEPSPDGAVECATEDAVESEFSTAGIQIRQRQPEMQIEPSPWEWTANPRRKHVRRFVLGEGVAGGIVETIPVTAEAETVESLSPPESGLTEIEDSIQSNSWAEKMIVPPASETSATEEKDSTVGTLSQPIKEPSLPASPVHPDVPDSSSVELDLHPHPSTPPPLAEQISSPLPKSDIDTSSEELVSREDKNLSKTDNAGQEAYVGNLLQLIVQPILATAAANYSSSDLKNSKLHGSTTSIGSMHVNVVTITTCACQREVDKKLVQPTVLNCFCYPDSQQKCGEKIDETEAPAEPVGVVESTTTKELTGKVDASNRKAFVFIFLLGVLSASAFFVLSKFCKHVQNGPYFSTSSSI